jgi:hypothetical protein
MSTAYVYTDVSERYGVRAFACVVLFENNHHWEVGECPPTDLSCSYAEVSSLHRGILRALQLAPDATLTAYTDIDCIIELLARRRCRGQLKPLLTEMQLLLDANPGVRVVSVPRHHALYQECHRRARATAKHVMRTPGTHKPLKSVTPASDGVAGPVQAVPKPAKHPSPASLRKLPSPYSAGYQPPRKSEEWVLVADRNHQPVQRIDVLQAVFDLGAASVVGTEEQRAEARELLGAFKLKYPALVGVYPRG